MIWLGKILVGRLLVRGAYWRNTVVHFTKNGEMKNPMKTMALLISFHSSLFYAQTDSTFYCFALRHYKETISDLETAPEPEGSCGRGS